jgi:hypothetical protein
MKPDHECGPSTFQNLGIITARVLKKRGIDASVLTEGAKNAAPVQRHDTKTFGKQSIHWNAYVVAAETARRTRNPADEKVADAAWLDLLRAYLSDEAKFSQRKSSIVADSASSGITTTIGSRDTSGFHQQELCWTAYVAAEDCAKKTRNPEDEKLADTAWLDLLVSDFPKRINSRRGVNVVT